MSAITLPDSVTDIADLYLRIADRASALPGANHAAVFVGALDCIEAATGLPMDGIRKAFPPTSTDKQPGGFSALEIAEKLRWQLDDVNEALNAKGWQVAPCGKWLLTNEGAKHGHLAPNDPTRPILWNDSVVDMLIAEVGFGE